MNRNQNWLLLCSKKCCCCGKTGHNSPMSGLKEKVAKEDWAINKAKSYETEEQSRIITHEAKSSSTDEGYKNELATGDWTGAQILFYEANEMKDDIILDNVSTVNIICNPNLVENSTTGSTDEARKLLTNGEDVFKKKRATVSSEYGEVWCDLNLGCY